MRWNQLFFLTMVLHKLSAFVVFAWGLIIIFWKDSFKKIKITTCFYFQLYFQFFNSDFIFVNFKLRLLILSRNVFQKYLHLKWSRRTLSKYVDVVPSQEQEEERGNGGGGLLPVWPKQVHFAQSRKQIFLMISFKVQA